jgi:hypothetical protein
MFSVTEQCSSTLAKQDDICTNRQQLPACLFDFENIAKCCNQAPYRLSNGSIKNMRLNALNIKNKSVLFMIVCLPMTE